MTIKDDATICMHCGQTFQNYGVDPPPAQENFYQQQRPMARYKPKFEEKKSNGGCIVAIIVIIVVIILGVAIAYPTLSSKINVNEAIEKVKETTYQKIVNEYYARTYDAILSNDLYPKDGSTITDGYYYVLIDETQKGKEYPINLETSIEESIYGYVLIHIDTTKSPHKAYYVCIENENKERYDGQFPASIENDRFKMIPKEKSQCNTSEDLASISAKMLVEE